MSDRAEVMQKNTFSVITVACFLLLCLGTFLNTYRIVLLEKDVQRLENARKNLEDEMFYMRIPNNYNRRRRSFVNGLNHINKSKAEEADEINLISHSHGESKGVEISESAVHKRDSLPNAIFSRTKYGTAKKRDFKNRNSKGMHSDDVSSHHNMRKSSLNFKSLDPSSYDSNEYNTETSRAQFLNAEIYPRSRMQLLDDRYPRNRRTKPILSIHLSGDTSKYTVGTDENYEGNGHLKHLQNIFVDWKPNNWVEKSGMMARFSLDDGYLTIKESGLYLIYAQIHYVDKHDVNSFGVYKNGGSILQCTVSMHTNNQRRKRGNTCYTAGVEYISEGDRINLADHNYERYTYFAPGQSFFGVVKLGELEEKV